MLKSTNMKEECWSNWCCSESTFCWESFVKVEQSSSIYHCACSLTLVATSMCWRPFETFVCMWEDFPVCHIRLFWQCTHIQKCCYVPVLWRKFAPSTPFFNLFILCTQYALIVQINKPNGRKVQRSQLEVWTRPKSLHGVAAGQAVISPASTQPLLLSADWSSVSLWVTPHCDRQDSKLPLVHSSYVTLALLPRWLSVLLFHLQYISDTTGQREAKHIPL